MPLLVHRRPYDAFLSHAHADRDFAGEIYRWLVNTCEFSIWYDTVQMPGGSPIGSGLQHAIEYCRGLLLIGSSQAINQPWVKSEIAVAQVEANNAADFRIVPLRLANADVASVVKGLSWIDLPAGHLDRDAAAGILRAFYPGDNRPDPRTSRDVYVSASWHSADNKSAVAVIRSLCDAGFRLIGDATNQKGFGADRIKSIIESCGAFVGVIPYRDNEASASAKNKPYKYFLTELDIAAKAGIPAVVVADPKIRRVDGDDAGWLSMDTQESQCPGAVQTAIDDLWEQWRKPPYPHYVFLATDLDSGSAARSSAAREIIERITGMPTVIGTDINEPDLQTAIMRTIKESFLVIADISGASDDTFNLNCCIEAGMAAAYGANVALMAKGRPRSPPFMLRRAGQLSTYENDVEQLGIIHRVVRQYRRRVLNAELPRMLRQA